MILPAFGRPTRPTSASSFRRSSSVASSPARPRSANRGACRVEVANRLLPPPPLPPRATTTRAPGGGEIEADAAREVLDHGPVRHAQVEVVAGSAMAPAALAVPPTSALK